MDLKKLITKGESETVEFKKNFNTDVIETAVAFANTQGGVVLLGVSDSGQAIAQTFGKEALRDYVNRVAAAFIGFWMPVEVQVCRSRYVKFFPVVSMLNLCLPIWTILF